MVATLSQDRSWGRTDNSRINKTRGVVDCGSNTVARQVMGLDGQMLDNSRINKTRRVVDCGSNTVTRQVMGQD